MLAGCGGNNGNAGGTSPGDITEERESRVACAATPSPPTSVITAGATMWPEPPGQGDVLNRIREEGDSRFVDVFAGLEVVPERGEAIVYRVPSAEFDDYVRAAAIGQCILIRDAAHSNARLRVVQERITDDIEYWRGKGIRINMVGTQHDGSGVLVGTEDVERARAELSKRYGTEIPILAEEQEPAVPLR